MGLKFGTGAVNCREPLAQLAYRRIKDEILDQRLLPRQPLVEAELAARYGMSKTPIREALLTLARERLVEFSSFRGGRVRDFTAEDAREIYEVRELLEPFALERAAPRLGEDELRSLRSLLEDAKAAAKEGDRRRLSRLNRAFHSALVAGCGHERVIEILSQMQDQVGVMSLRLWSVQATHLHEASQHEAVLEAIEAGEVGRAARLLREHISEFKDRYICEWSE
jgi:DNA-binding GntR family transcriptional regulator